MKSPTGRFLTCKGTWLKKLKEQQILVLVRNVLSFDLLSYPHTYGLMFVYHKMDGDLLGWLYHHFSIFPHFHLRFSKIRACVSSSNKYIIAPIIQFVVMEIDILANGLDSAGRE